MNDDTIQGGDTGEFKAPVPQPLVQVSEQPAVKSAVDQNLKKDISRILEEVKLPERRESEKKPEPLKQQVVPPAQAKTPEPPQAVPAVETAQGQITSSVTPSVHTLKEDLQHVIQEKKISVVRAAALEEDRKVKQEPIHVTPVRHARRLWPYAILIAVIVLCGAFFASYTLLSGPPQESQATQLPSLIFAEQTYPVELTDEPARSIKTELSTFASQVNLTLGAIARIAPIQTNTTGSSAISATVFLQKIGAGAPDELVRALGSDFFFGVHSISGNAPLLIFQVTSYDRAFASMLEWESTIGSGLAPIFPDIAQTIPGPDGTPIANAFVDDVIRNYDVRELKDEHGVVKLYYSFPTRSLLVIAKDPNSFPEILSRLRAAGRL